ncbi:PspC domain-containing protein [Candidatus Wolfebacteria bacterium]|nr:PspC domain-containing protein [Candidatus Wolfebacteria bacterium]
MRKIYLSEKNKKIAGLLGGVGEAYDMDPTLLRIIVILLGVLTGFLPMIIAYLLAWLVTPKQQALTETQIHL